MRRALEVALADPAQLAERGGAGGGGATVRLGALPMSAELAARVSTAAQSLGVSVAEVVRRALAP